MIKFSAPWCYHCAKMKPSWIAAAKELGSNVRFATINAADNRDIARDFGISMLPTIKFYKAGYGKTAESAEQYSGTRDEQSLKDFAHELNEEFQTDRSKFDYESDVEFGGSTYTDAPMPTFEYQPQEDTTEDEVESIEPQQDTTEDDVEIIEEEEDLPEELLL